MSTKQTWVRDIVRRLRLIHWRVEETTSGYRVYCPNGEIVHLHNTPSDSNAMDNAMQELKRSGLAEAEAEHNRVKLEERERRNKLIKEGEDKDLARAARHADALRRAAGIRDVTIEELLRPSPMPKTFERVLVTPEIATALLAVNTDNRPIRPRDVTYWSDIIDTGQWLYTHQGIALDTRGVLQDGQHRLSAVVNTGQSVEMQINIGMPQENFTVIDTGTKRSYGDVIYRYDIPNRNKIASVARTVTIYEELPLSTFRDRVPSSTIDRFVRESSEELLAAYNKAQAIYNATRLNVTAGGAFLYLLWRDSGQDHPKVSEFVEGLITGIGFEEGDPRAALRRQTLSPFNRRAYNQHLALLIIAWNKWLSGKRIQTIMWRPSVQEFPRMLLPEVASEDAPKADVE